MLIEESHKIESLDVSGLDGIERPLALVFARGPCLDFYIQLLNHLFNFFSGNFKSFF